MKRNVILLYEENTLKREKYIYKYGIITFSKEK